MAEGDALKGDIAHWTLGRAYHLDQRLQRRHYGGERFILHL
jgi:hypothetical protein